MIRRKAGGGVSDPHEQHPSVRSEASARRECEHPLLGDSSERMWVAEGSPGGIFFLPLLLGRLGHTDRRGGPCGGSLSAKDDKASG